MNGKGSARRPLLINRTIFESNWDLIFNKHKNICIYFSSGKCTRTLKKSIYCIGFSGCTNFEEKYKCQQK